jgi:hypothetical protein
MRVDLADAEEALEITGKTVGYAHVTRRRHDREPTGKLAHLWWYRCLERAELSRRGRHAGCTCTVAVTPPQLSCNAPATIFA